MSGVASLKSVFWSEFEPFPGTPWLICLATLSILSKSLLVLNLGTLTPSGVNKYRDPVTYVSRIPVY